MKRRAKTRQAKGKREQAEAARTAASCTNKGSTQKTWQEPRTRPAGHAATQSHRHEL